MNTNGAMRPRAAHVRLLAPCLAVTLLLNPFAYAQQSQSKQSPGSSSAPHPQAARPEDDNAPVPPMPPLDPSELASPTVDLLPDSPGAVESARLENQEQPGTAQSPSTNQPPQPAPPLPPKESPKEPLGTAAAETVPTMGIAASQPAGAALAPAKQRRIRTILIRTGALVGAAAALGATMALTEGSPSKPPGAH